LAVLPALRWQPEAFIPPAPGACALDACLGGLNPELFNAVIRVWDHRKRTGRSVHLIPEVPVCGPCRGRVGLREIIGPKKARERLREALVAELSIEPVWETATLTWAAVGGPVPAPVEPKVPEPAKVQAEAPPRLIFVPASRFRASG
jgi:hypothetical protein